MELETTFYIVGILYMVVMLALTIALVTAVLVIKHKINKIHQMVDEKVAKATAVAGRVSAVFSTFRQFVRR